MDIPSQKSHMILEEKEHDFQMQLNKAIKSLSLLDMDSYEVDNTLDIQEWHSITTSTYTGTSAYHQALTQTSIYKTKHIFRYPEKTDMFDLQDQYANYIVENGKDGKQVSNAEVDDFKKAFYKQALSTSFDHKVYNDGWWNTASTTLDFIPIVGGIKEFIEGCVGKTMSGE